MFIIWGIFCVIYVGSLTESRHLTGIRSDAATWVSTSLSESDVSTNHKAGSAVERTSSDVVGKVAGAKRASDKHNSEQEHVIGVETHISGMTSVIRNIPVEDIKHPNPKIHQLAENDSADRRPNTDNVEIHESTIQHSEHNVKTEEKLPNPVKELHPNSDLPSKSDLISHNDMVNPNVEHGKINAEFVTDHTIDNVHQAVNVNTENVHKETNIHAIKDVHLPETNIAEQNAEKVHVKGIGEQSEHLQNIVQLGENDMNVMSSIKATHIMPPETHFDTTTSEAELVSHDMNEKPVSDAQVTPMEISNNQAMPDAHMTAMEAPANLATPNAQVTPPETSNNQDMPDAYMAPMEAPANLATPNTQVTQPETYNNQAMPDAHMTPMEAPANLAAPNAHVTQPETSNNQAMPDAHMTPVEALANLATSNAHVTQPETSNNQAMPDAHMTPMEAPGNLATSNAQVTSPETSNNQAMQDAHITSMEAPANLATPNAHVTQPETYNNQAMPDAYMTPMEAPANLATSNAHVTQPETYNSQAMPDAHMVPPKTQHKPTTSHIPSHIIPTQLSFLDTAPPQRTMRPATSVPRERTSTRATAPRTTAVSDRPSSVVRRDSSDNEDVFATMQPAHVTDDWTESSQVTESWADYETDVTVTNTEPTPTEHQPDDVQPLDIFAKNVKYQRFPRPMSLTTLKSKVLGKRFKKLYILEEAEKKLFQHVRQLEAIYTIEDGTLYVSLLFRYIYSRECQEIKKFKLGRVVGNTDLAMFERELQDGKTERVLFFSDRPGDYVFFMSCTDYVTSPYACRDTYYITLDSTHDPPNQFPWGDAARELNTKTGLTFEDPRFIFNFVLLPCARRPGPTPSSPTQPARRHATRSTN